MNNNSRLKKSIINAKVNLFFYIVILGLSFFSRKIFLDCLGDEFIGLSGTLTNILSFLSLAEMGVGTAVGFNLYKPLLENNTKRINELVSLFGYLYRRIGIIIFASSLLVYILIPFIFNSTNLSLGIIYFSFTAILFSSLCSYFINYKQILLSADQKNYIVTKYIQTSLIIKVIIQILIAYFLKNIYLWLILEFLFSISVCFILNWRIQKEYPWLNVSIKAGKLCLPQNSNIINCTKQIFIHKIKDFLLSQSDQIFVFAFVSLKMVAFYGNYTLIITKLSQVFITTIDGISASVGNLVAEENKNNTIKVFWEIYCLNYFIGGIIVFSLFHLMEPFITLWLGEEYILNRSILILLLVNTFIMESRKAVDLFNSAHGLYADTWSAWVEAIINLSVTIILAPQIGIAGILLGKIISLSIVVICWKPYYLFTSGFKIKYYNYIQPALTYLLVLIISFYFCHFIISYIHINPNNGFINWIIYSIIITIIFTTVYAIMLYKFCTGAKDLYIRIFNKLLRKII